MIPHAAVDARPESTFSLFGRRICRIIQSGWLSSELGYRAKTSQVASDDVKKIRHNFIDAWQNKTIIICIKV